MKIAFTTLLTSFLLGGSAAQAGYGDVGEDGLPSASERELHIWTNAARVDPEAFKDDYQAGGCSFDADFSDDEKTPKLPVYWDHGLNEAARFHSDDMESSGNFSHDSSDGTPFSERLARFYDSGFVGENIAYGYSDNFNVVFAGWMCSTTGHRANIMSGDWNELGTGVVSSYYTQNFGQGSAESAGPVAMGAHSPPSATAEAVFRADWQDAAAPVRLEVVLDGAPKALSLEFGTDEAGVFMAKAMPAPGDCHSYWFRWETAAGETGALPETGSYLYGADCPEPTGWRAEQPLIGGGDGGSDGATDFSALGALDDGETPKLVGCATTTAPTTGWLGLIAAPLLVLRRRARR